MLGNYFYHQNIRKTIIAFGNLFNEIHIKHKDDEENDYSELRVPLAYGPTQKFLARLEQQEDLNKPVASGTIPIHPQTPIVPVKAKAINTRPVRCREVYGCRYRENRIR